MARVNVILDQFKCYFTRPRVPLTLHSQGLDGLLARPGKSYFGLDNGAFDGPRRLRHGCRLEHADAPVAEQLGKQPAAKGQGAALLRLLDVELPFPFSC